MKIRKAVNQINKELLKEIRIIAEDHSCQKYVEEGMSCVMCALLNIGKPLVLIHYLRNKGLISGHLDGEVRLLELLGTERFKQKIKSEIDMVRNTPKKRCFNCGKIVTMWMPYSWAAILIDSRPNKEMGIKCRSCGVLIYFSSKEVRKKTDNHDVKNLIFATQLANRMGYHQPDDPENEENNIDDMEYQDDQDNDDFYDPDE